MIVSLLWLLLTLNLWLLFSVFLYRDFNQPRSWGTLVALLAITVEVVTVYQFIDLRWYVRLWYPINLTNSLVLMGLFALMAVGALFIERYYRQSKMDHKIGWKAAAPALALLTGVYMVLGLGVAAIIGILPLLAID